MLCRVLQVSRSAYYEWVAGRTWKQKRDRMLEVHIRAAHRRSHGTYGSPRIRAELRALGLPVGRRSVARLMKRIGISGTPKKRFRGSTTDSDHQLQIAPNLLKRQFQVCQPNTAWVGDITYLPVQDGWVYLAVLIDLFSRKVVGWAVQETMETELCLKALRRAVTARGNVQGTIHHTDRGSQYASKAYRSSLARSGFVQSMSRKGNCWDNAVAESFFGTLEQELMPEQPWRDVEAARAAVGRYIHHYYNLVRRHSTLGYISPISFETAHKAAERQAA